MRKVLALVMAICLCFSFAGCGKKEPAVSGIGSGTDNVNEAASGKEAEKSEKMSSFEVIPNDASGIPSARTLETLYDACPGSKYICYENEGGSASIYSYTRDDFSDLFESAAAEEVFQNMGFSKESSVLERIEKNALISISHLTEREGTLLNTPKDGENSYLSYNNTGVDCSAFGALFKDGISVTEYFESENLKLIVSDPKLICLISSKTMAESLYACAAVVKADVICVKNDGAFSDIAWIPQKGSSREVTFTVTFMSFLNNETHNILINDISAK